ncbi:MAG: copper-translocating P-type ATPase [Herpetosiphonaceae bacterium]|nr:MAG: copper-translocating P-type ATPase [Herpetosiphonaceae bacterium]
MRTTEIPVQGMDCTSCVAGIRQALSALPGVEGADVLLSAEKAVVRYDPAQVDETTLRSTIRRLGYTVPEQESAAPAARRMGDITRPILVLFGVLFAVILGVVVLGERLGLLESLTERVPWPVGLLLVLIAGYPVFVHVIRAALRGQIISHTLMSLGVIAALAVGEWATAAVVVFFMRVGDYVEHFTTSRARRAVKDLTAMAPRTARVVRGDQEIEVPLESVQVGETVVVRPGEQIPVDGEVVEGQATVDQAAITGESMPVEVGPGQQVFAATIAKLGSLRVRTTRIGRDTTFGKVITLVEEAEAHRADIQRTGDRFAAWYLPVVALIAALTFLIRRDPLATAAVLVVACSCSFALATPVAMLASIGAGARRGLLIKGGKYLELLAQADVILLDKTGTLTLGRPRITDIVPLNGVTAPDLLALAAAAERDSEHPLAEAVRERAAAERVVIPRAECFEAIPGVGVRARIDGQMVSVGSQRSLPAGISIPEAAALEAQGKTLVLVSRDQQVIGVLAAADTVRLEVAAALKRLTSQGIRQIELLTGDNERVAAAVAQTLGIGYRANLLPEDKIALVRAYQSQGQRVIMVGDGVNDAPALAQADVGIAMGVRGTDIAIEAAHVVLLREDWMLVPQVLELATRTMRVIRLNIGFTVLYNLIGLSLAALGLLPPILAAAAQSLPDLGILANSSRLLRFRPEG